MIHYNEKYDNEIMDIVIRYPKNFISVLKSKGFKHRCENRQYLINYIMQCTPMLIDTTEFKYSLKTRLFWTLNKIQDWTDDRVRCIVCKKPMVGTDIRKLNNGYKKTCCKQCERKLAQQNIEKHLYEIHGVTNAFQLKDVIEKLNCNKDSIQRKRDKTKQRNKTFKTSRDEERAYQMLCNAFSKDNIVRQFKDEKRYPFCCDFYVKSKDMFVECNFSWTHGGHWFNENDENDLNKLELMKTKHSKYYDNVIETWTIRDVNKRKIAKDNNLNYVVFWTLDELKDFLHKTTKSSAIAEDFVKHSSN